MRNTLLAMSALVALAGCAGQAKSDVATVDMTRIVGNWPKYANYANQLQSDQAAIETSRAPERDKGRLRAELAQRYVQFSAEIAADVNGAAEQVAKTKNLKMVFTRQGVGYGGVDITADVEKILKIEEKPPAKP